jgi:outer membrane protein assembly factor BamB
MRRTTICCSATALAILIAAVLPAQPIAPRRPVKQTHAADDKTPLSPVPLSPAWTITLNSALIERPAYDDTRGFFPIEGGRIVAYDLIEQLQLWTAPIQVASPPVAAEGLLFVEQSHAVAAFRAADGTAAWSMPLAAALAAPLVWDNGWLVAASSSGDLLVFRALDGHLIWQRNLGSPASVRPALAADRVYLATTDHRIVALRVDTGAPVWEHEIDGTPGEMLAQEDRLFVGASDKYFHCLNADDGSESWLWRTGADAIGTAVADDDTVYFVAVDNVMRALNRRSGVQRWKTPLPLRPSAGPIEVNGTLLVSGLAPSLRAFHTSDGKPAGDLTTGGDMPAPPHLLYARGAAVPIVVVVTRDIVKGAIVSGLTRSFDPPIGPLAPLPNLVPATPPGPSSP